MKNQTMAISKVFLLAVALSCTAPGQRNSEGGITNDLDLKRGEIIVCGTTDSEFGNVQFPISCSRKVRADFDLGVALLHSFEYDEAEKVFAKVIDAEPGCAMGYWGVAMSNYHPLWDVPSAADLEKGSSVLSLAASLTDKSNIEKEYIDAIATFYKDWATVDHKTRSMHYAKAMDELFARHPESREAGIFYSLALIATADPQDKTYQNQKRAGAILKNLYPEGENHPGIVHYLIHAYDSPELAAQALAAARKYASIAPSSAHAQHMPSHIFTRLGLWDECVQSNLVSTSSARCYAENAGFDAHWDEELHGLDYLVYAYLQKGENALARKQYDYLKTITEVYPVNFKGAYAFAAIPSRYYLENRLWNEAANLTMHPKDFPWEEFPWQQSMFHFTRMLGAVHIGNLDSAHTEMGRLQKLHDLLVTKKEAYKAEQVLIQMEAGKAWLLHKGGDNQRAVQLMSQAAEREAQTEKHPVTPGSVIPARELLGDLFLSMERFEDAFGAYEAALKDQPNRFNSVYGAAYSCERMGDARKAKTYYNQLLTFSNSPHADRSEIEKAKTFVAKY